MLQLQISQIFMLITHMYTMLAQNYSFQDLLHARFKEIDLFRKLPTVKVAEIENVVEGKCTVIKKTQPRTLHLLFTAMIY